MATNYSWLLQSQPLISHFKRQGRIKKFNLESERKVGLRFLHICNCFVSSAVQSPFSVCPAKAQKHRTQEPATESRLLLKSCWWKSVLPLPQLTRSPWQLHSWCLPSIFIGSPSKRLGMCKLWGKRGNPCCRQIPARSRLALLREVTGCIWDDSLVSEGFLSLLLVV